ncbi:MAG: hypothetical protein RJA19_1980 [Bacteroidota bacterium]
MGLREFRERVNVVLYGHKSRVLATLRWMNLLVSITALSLLVAYYGWPNDSATASWILWGVTWSFGFYVFQYFLKVVYEFHPWTFIRQTWIEALLMVVLVVEGISDVITGELLLEKFARQQGIPLAKDFYTLFIQGYFFVVVATELVRSSSILPRIRLHPASIFLASFLLLIAGGTGLLMMPEMSSDLSGVNFLDALFASTSASCVTGLLTVDIDVFSQKGHWVMLFLMQFGGLNLIAFGIFLSLVAKLGLGVRHDEVIQDFLTSDNLQSGRGLLGKVMIWILLIEGLGTLGLYLTWSSQVPFASEWERFFASLFHAVASFNNGGISTFPGGFAAPYAMRSLASQWVMFLLIFAGSLGILALFDLFDPVRLRDRMKHPWKQIQFSTKIALYFSLGLIFAGALSHLILEQNFTQRGMIWSERITTAFFMSINRTAGFSSIDLSMASATTILITIFLMFIGSSSSSTGGGIKTSTLAVILADLWRTIKGFDHVQLFQRTIPEILRSRAYSVLLFFLGWNMFTVFVLSITESEILAIPGRGVIDLMFESVSAMSTVGLSTGITSFLSPIGKVMIILNMFIGRVGALTIILGISGKVVQSHIKYPEAHTMIG